MPGCSKQSLLAYYGVEKKTHGFLGNISLYIPYICDARGFLEMPHNDRSLTVLSGSPFGHDVSRGDVLFNTTLAVRHEG